MATEQNPQGFTYIQNGTTLAAADQYKIVKFSTTANAVELATAATDKIAGVIETVPRAAAGEVLLIVMSGIKKVRAGGSVSVGDTVTADSTSRAATMTPGAGTLQYKLGVAKTASTAAGQLIEVQLFPGPQNV